MDAWIAEEDIDDCEPNPCQHKGVCKDIGKAFQCTCSDGWQGRRCRYGTRNLVVQRESRRDSELTSPTSQPLPRTRLPNLLRTFSIFIPRNADAYPPHSADANDCDPSPCLNGGLCMDLGNRVYLCRYKMISSTPWTLTFSTTYAGARGTGLATTVKRIRVREQYLYKFCWRTLWAILICVNGSVGFTIIFTSAIRHELSRRHCNLPWPYRRSTQSSAKSVLQVTVPAQWSM